MPDKFIHEFFKWVYAREIEHKDRQDTGDSLLAALLTVLSGAGIYYLKILPFPASNGFEVWFLIGAFLYARCFAYGVFSLMLSMWPRNQALISSPEEFAKFISASKTRQKRKR